MRIRLVIIFVVAATLATMPGNPSAAPTRRSAVSQPDAISALIASLHQSIKTRDSLTSLADRASGTARDYLEELIWQRHAEIHAGVMALADRIKTEEGRGKDMTEVRQALNEAVREEWPAVLVQLQRRQQALIALGKSSDAASGIQRLAIESEMTQQSERLLEAVQSLVEAILALERVGIDVSEQRAFAEQQLRATVQGLLTRVQLANRDRASEGARLSRDPSNAELRYALESAEERFTRVTHSLSTATSLMDRLGIETTDLRVALIVATGRMTADVLNWRVFLGLLKTLWGQFIEFLAGKALQWLFQALLIAITFIGFRALSRVVRSAVRRAVKHSQFSQLLRDTLVRLSGYGVMIIGFVVILTQLGVNVAPLLAGLGIAGFIVGFAMQNTLSNFAAGGMILGNQPFDVGDEIEVAGVLGTVKRMSLVSTTILTADNQTLIVPNSTVWGGAIRNRTAQPLRRVDMTFSIGYGDDLEKAERVLREVVIEQPSVLKGPAPIIKVHQLADSSVNFVVRAWTTKELYWDVYWDLTRAVKLRFDKEGITIPFPQRELHVNVGKGGTEAAVATLGAAPRDATSPASEPVARRADQGSGE